ncbi:MAG: cytochrome c [Bdellovibrionales bacterium]
MQNDTYNRGGFIAFIFSMVFSLAFFVYIVAVHPGVDLKEVQEEVAAPEQTVAGGAEVKAVDVSKVEKPWISSEDMVAHGAKVFGSTCAVCHGPKGMGDGPAGMSLNPKPRNLVEGKWKRGGDSISLFKTVTEGLPGTAMAQFGHLPLVDRWALVHFIHSITQDKGKDDEAKVEAFAKGAK